MSVVIEVPPRMMVSVDISFSCAFENELIIREHSGEEVFVANSHTSSTRHWESPGNTSNHPLMYELRGRHKKGKPNPNLPWIASKSKVHPPENGVQKVGFEDGDDGDFNDAFAEIKRIRL